MPLLFNLIIVSGYSSHSLLRCAFCGRNLSTQRSRWPRQEWASAPRAPGSPPQRGAWNGGGPSSSDDGELCEYLSFFKTVSLQSIVIPNPHAICQILNSRRKKLLVNPGWYKKLLKLYRCVCTNAKCGQVRCHLLVGPCQILPQDSTSLLLSILSVCVQFSSKNDTAPLLINHASLIKVYASMVQICGRTILFLSRNWQTTMALIRSIS